jgi:hypothetical protein
VHLDPEHPVQLTVIPQTRLTKAELQKELTLRSLYDTYA